jgi:GAF domain-containing protein
MADSEYTWSGAQKIGSYRAALGAPLLRNGRVVGVLFVTRNAPEAFSSKHVELVETFADQAVIAIENTRLFEEVQARTRQVQESLDYQLATSDVLNVISRSPTDIQPVFETIAQSAAHLCEAKFCRVFRFDGKLIHYAASHGVGTKGLEATSNLYPMAPGRGSAAARAILSGAVEQIPDVQADPEYAIGRGASVIGFRSVAAVPMLKEGRPIGAIAILRSQAGLLPERQITLLRTFADQAVIAIENTCLFEEVQARTRALQESREYQTAMSDVLGVISSSPDRLQPVLEAIVNTAKRLCIADRAYFNVLLEGRYHSVAATAGIPKHIIDDVRAKPEAPGRGSHAARAILEKRPIHIEDTRLDPEFTLYDVNEPGRARTVLGVPLLRRHEVIGVITLARIEPAPFTQRQIDLVATFANQAVIAINNVDLFEEVQARTKELQESLEYQTATS